MHACLSGSKTYTERQTRILRDYASQKIFIQKVGYRWAGRVYMPLNVSGEIQPEHFLNYFVNHIMLICTEYTERP